MSKRKKLDENVISLTSCMPMVGGLTRSRRDNFTYKGFPGTIKNVEDSSISELSEYLTSVVMGESVNIENFTEVRDKLLESVDEKKKDKYKEHLNGFFKVVLDKVFNG